MRWLRRWWARITHKHDWVVIYRSVTMVTERLPLSGVKIGKYKCPSVLERCHCGKERARRWQSGKWIAEDLDYLNDWIARQNIEIPARHQE